MQPNSKEYLDALYSGDWKAGYKDAYLRLDKDIELLPEYNNHLDIGCADGYFTKMYLDKYPKSTGIGIDISAVVVANSENIQADCYKLPFGQEFDLVHAAELIEHLEDPQKAIDEMKRVLLPGGCLVLTTPYKEFPLYEEHLWSWTSRKVIALLKDFEILRLDTNFYPGIMHVIAQCESV